MNKNRMDRVSVKLGDFVGVRLDRENPWGSKILHVAFVRYNGIIPNSKEGVMAFEIGRYDENKAVQKGSPYYLPVGEKKLNCRVDTYGRRVEWELEEVSPLEIKAIDKTELPTAVDD